MIQRRQTVYLLLALASLIVCLCLPIGKIDDTAGKVVAVWYNYGLTVNNVVTAHPLLFVELIVTGVLTLITIFLYHRRKLQMTLCLGCIFLCGVWYGSYAFYASETFDQLGTFKFCFAACLPLVAIIFFFLARKGVKHDEDLIKSMDRMR